MKDGRPRAKDLGRAEAVRRRRPLVWWAAGALFTLAAAAWGATRPAPDSRLAGSVWVVPTLRKTVTYSLGEFRLTWDGAHGAWRITHMRTGDHEVFATPAGQAFLLAARGGMTAPENIGYFYIRRWTDIAYTIQTVDDIREEDGALVVRGTLRSDRGDEAAYELTWRAEAADRLAYDVKVSSMQGPAPNRLYLTFATQPGEHFYGFGVQFSTLDMKGRRLPILVQEHGNGRGMQPLTLLADITHGGAGGHWYNTYAPVPYMLTSTMQALFSKNSEYQVFDFTDPRAGELEVDADHIQGDIFAGTTPAALTQAYTAVIGRMQPLPAWTQQGFIFGAEGGTQTVLSHLRQLLAAHVPITGLWIQDWVGQRRTSFGDQLIWNWTLNPDQYPDWNAFTAQLHALGIHLLGYVNPFLTDVSSYPRLTNLYEEALLKGYFVKGPDGRPVVFQYPNFTASLIDLTNPSARQWLEQVMLQELVGNGFDGWMADFGEELPLSVTTADGSSGLTLHNLYPVLWAQVNRDVLQAAGLAGKGLVFMRSGFSPSPGVITDLWLGDQLESWDPDNGLPSAVTGLLSAGLSGFTMVSSDVGGYTSLTQFPFHYVRDDELLMRWMELDAFTTLFRSHEGNQPDKNVQVYSNPDVMAELRRCVILFRDLAPYREQLMQQAAATGVPVDRPMFFEYPEDPVAWQVADQQFMLGPDVIVAPVLAPHQTSVKVYLPAGDWVHLWSGRVYHVAQGETITLPAPIGQPAVLYRAGSTVATQFQQALADIRQADAGQ
ncbi:MAG: alpha-glucosidase [Thermoflavifilum sp.]|nr:alpha-glucosidase [Thermoflavifilum sp.]MCL6514524.1 alpha-glucosidase [Alicyclobacillus sp.]